ncbi:MAG: VCBS repeat-containing protein [bacterium]|nr:VCBS repeat-containing protein [bacterium]
MIRFLLMFAALFTLGLPISAFCGILVDSGEQFLGITQASLSWGDYDNDKDLDLAVCGLDKTGQPVTRVYKNEPGSVTFQEDMSQKIEGVSYGRVNWHDYNGDGRLDLAVAGYNADRQPVSKIYQNIDGILIEDTTQHPQIRYGSVAWTDSNKDGEQDSYCMAGCDEATNWQPYTKIYRKANDGEFVEDVQTLVSTYYGSLDWGDYDGDGDLDLVVSGWLPDGAVIKVYNNDKGRFVEDTKQSLIPVFHSSIAFGDYDMDGNLDLIVAGQTMSGSRTTTLYKNEAGIFTVDTTQVLPGVIFCCVNWIDYDHDGDIDLALAGEDSAGVPILKLYNNEQSIPVPIHRIMIVANPSSLDSLSTDDTLSLEAKGYDEAGNFVRNVPVQWGIQGDIGVLSGIRGAMVTFDPRKPGTGSIIAQDGKGHTAQLDNVTVTPGVLHHLIVTGMDNNPIQHVSLLAGDTITLISTGYDADNNLLGQVQANWGVSGNIGTLSDSIGTMSTFSAMRIGTGSIIITDEKQHSGCTGMIAVNSGELAYLEIAPIQDKIVEEAFEVNILACDAMGNPVNSQSGHVVLLDSAGVMGSVTLMFENGIAVGSISIPSAVLRVSILAQANNKQGKSNTFNVIGSRISGGMYRDAEETQKLAMAYVPIKAYKVSSNNELILKGTASTSPDGDYEINGLPQGTYTVAILPPANYRPMMATKIARVSITKGIKGAPSLAGQLSGINFVLTPMYTDLKEMVVYPNPLSLAQGQTSFTFGQLPPNHPIRIKVYNIAGELVYEKGQQLPVNNSLLWGAVNDNGDRVASGVYIFLIEDETNGDQRKGKIAVIR